MALKVVLLRGCGKMLRLKDKGFTLIEILVVIIIIGILATLGMVNYSGVKERALGKEAIASLKLMAAAEKIYRMEQGGYFPVSGGGQSNLTAINNNLKLSLTNTSWNYNISGGNTTFTAYADRQGSGGYLNCLYTLTYNDTDGEPDPTNCP